MKADRKYARTMRIDLLMDDHSARRATEASPGKGGGRSTFESRVPETDFNTLLQSLYDAAVLTDFNGVITNVNERALVFFDYRRDAITGLNIENLIAGANTEILATVITNARAGRFTLLQAHCQRSDGSLFPAEISVTCLTLSPAPFLCFFIRDISMRREVEEQLRIEHDAVQNAGSGIAITDPGGTIRYTNPSMCGLWDFSQPDDLLSGQIQDLFTSPAAVDDAMAGAANLRTWQGEMQACRRDGAVFYVQTSITRCFDEDDVLTHLVFSFADTTKRRNDEEALRLYRDHLEDLIRERTADLEASNSDLRREVEEHAITESELREAINKLREHDQSKSQFVSNVSHELRTPLTSLIHSIESLMRGVAGPIPDPVFSYLTMMLEDGWRLDRTVNDILDLGRIESGRLTLNTACIPFHRMVERTTEAMRMEAESIPLTFRIEPDAVAGFVECDAAKMERVITNILGNAIKFTPPGGTVSIAVQAQDRNGADGICCRITDSGVGIPKQYIHRVTERYFRVGEQVVGTGLGLSIAREITERHQGALEITSPPPGNEKGTQVSLWLPLVPPPHVLIVSPDDSLSKDILAALRERGYHAACDNSGQHAMQMLRDGKTQMVIVNALLPDMDGTELIMHIKADALLRSLPVFFISEGNPAPAKSCILQNFDIPLFSSREGTGKLLAAVEDAFLPRHISVPVHAPR